MTKPENIAVVTVQWSDDYSGSILSGRYQGLGNEKYIFVPHQGKYYGYIPPNGNSFPQKDATRHWLIFFIARPSPKDRSVVVGWFEDATMTGHMIRPDFRDLGENPDGGHYSYSASTKNAVSIPAAIRDCIIPPGDSLRSFTYIRKDGKNAKSRVSLVNLLLKLRGRVSVRDASFGKVGGNVFPVDPVFRKKVEEAAIKAVKAQFPANLFAFTDKQKVPGTGYDLEFLNKSNKDIWCIEVKGAAGARPAFFITRAELNASKLLCKEEAEGGSRRWRLRVVTNALDPEKLRIQEFDGKTMAEEFDLECLQWQALPKDGNPA